MGGNPAPPGVVFTSGVTQTWGYNWYNVGYAIDIACSFGNSFQVYGGTLLAPGFDDLDGTGEFMLTVWWGPEVNGTPGMANVSMSTSHPSSPLPLPLLSYL
jgi:hypothetical protein